MAPFSLAEEENQRLENNGGPTVAETGGGSLRQAWPCDRRPRSRTQEEEMRRGKIWEVGFSLATPPVVAGIDGGVPRRPRDVQWQHRAGVVVCGDEEEEAARKGEVLVLIRVFKRFEHVFFVHPPS